MRRAAHVLTLFSALAGLGCAGEPTDTSIYPLPVEPPELLSEWHLFSDLPGQTAADGVHPYDVISPLFSDYAEKYRYLVIPEGTAIAYDDADEWVFPVGTVLIKTFTYARDPSPGRRILETRLLVREVDGWEPHTYVWNDAQTDAERVQAGATIDVSFVDAHGTPRTTAYVVPNTNECRECHGEGEALDTLGGVSRNLDLERDYGEGLENQIDRFARLGLFDTLPPPHADRDRLVDPFGDADLGERARSYLDVNCAMCHRETSTASESGMYLDWWSTDPARGEPTTYGVCKTPTSAGGATCGLSHDIVPGHPELSITSCRVRSDDPQIQMPPLGRTLVHARGADLVDAWIANLPPASCTP